MYRVVVDKEKLKEHIKGRGISLKYVSDKTGIPYRRVSGYFEGYVKMIDSEEFISMCNVVDANCEDFIKRKGRDESKAG